MLVFGGGEMSPPALVILGLLIGGLLMLLKLRSGGASKPAASSESSAPSKKLNWLVIESGPDAGLAFHIGSRRATIGRDKNNFVQISDPAASRVQCQLFDDGGVMTVVDMSSYNGTLVNDEVVNKGVLQDGDRLRVADTDFIYHREGDFKSNAGLGRKEAGSMTEAKTAFVQGRSVRQEAAAMLLSQNGGDKEAAAEAMKMTVEELEKLL
jgi:hypothetical protein